MADAATIDAPVTETEGSPEVRGPGFGNLAAQFESAMAEVHKAPEAKPPAEAPAPEKAAQPPAPKKEQPKQEQAKAPEKAPEQTKVAEPPKETEAAYVSPKAADWKKMVASNKELEKKAAEHETAAKTHAEKLAAIQKEYEEYRVKTTVDPKEIESIKKEREEYAAKLERVALAETPKFRDYYNSKFDAAMTQALDAVGKERADQIKAIMESPKSAWRKSVLTEIVGALDNEVDKLSLITAIQQYDATRAERDKELDNHKSALRELRSVEEKQSQEKQERENANRKAFAADVLKRAEAFDAFKPKDDDAEHNAQVVKNRKMVEEFIHGTMDVNLVGMLPVLAAQSHHLERQIKLKDVKISELEEALQKYQAANPDLGGLGDPKGEEKALSYSEQVKANLLSLGQAR